MTEHGRPDAVIAAFFRQAQADLPDSVFDIVRGDIHRTRQRIVFGPVGMPDARALWAAVGAAVAVAAVVAVAMALLGLPSVEGPGAVPSTPSPNPTLSAGHSSGQPSPSGPTVFTSPLYGYRITLPAGWSSTPATAPWNGRLQPTFGDAYIDNYNGPRQVVMLSFAGPFVGDLSALVDDRIAANARDHGGDCPPGSLQVNEPIDVGGQPGVLLGWNCGGLVDQALTVRDGVAYGFSFRDLAVKSARDPTDLALFRSILDSVELPATPPVKSP